MDPQHGRVEMLPPATPTPCSYMTLPQYTDHVAMRKRSACYNIPTDGHSMARTRTCQQEPQKNEKYNTVEKAIKIHN